MPFAFDETPPIPQRRRFIPGEDRNLAEGYTQALIDRSFQEYLDWERGQILAGEAIWSQPTPPQAVPLAVIAEEPPLPGPEQIHQAAMPVPPPAQDGTALLQKKTLSLAEALGEMDPTMRAIIASSLDNDTESHVRISQLIMERAKRLAEEGKNVFILLDSITRTARAFNKWTNTGRTATGGLDVRALDIPKKMFGSARQFEEGGSLTIVATALIETGSRADDAIFQEFKGTGNMELVVSRDLADRRIWPAIDITKSGTRHEEKLYDPLQFDSIVMLRRSLISLSPVEAMEMLSRTLDRFPSNTEFLEKVKSVL